MLMTAAFPLAYVLAGMLTTTARVCTVQGTEANPEDVQLAVSNPAWAQQASSALAAATRERVELQRAAVEAEDCIVRYHCHVLSLVVRPGPTVYYVCCHRKFLVSSVSLRICQPLPGPTI